jgi:hypothetical protein
MIPASRNAAQAGARVDEGGSRIASIAAIEASLNLQNLSRDERALPRSMTSEFVMQRPNVIKFPLKITEDCDLDGHARVDDANNALVFRLVAGDLEMLNAIVRELNIRATKLN